MVIKNYDEIIDELTKILMDFEIQLNEYQTDVYLYYDEKSQTASLDTFVNVGGNSWLNDDHYTIYCDREHHDSMVNMFEDIAAILDALEITEEQAKGIVAELRECEVDEIDEIDIWDVREILREDKYNDKLTEFYTDWVKEYESDYAERAVSIMDELEKELKEQEELKQDLYEDR